MRLALCVATALIMANASAKDSLKLVSNLQPDSPAYAAYEEFLQTVCQRSNLTCSISYRPLKRASYEFKGGQFDGDGGRSEVMAQIYPEAIRVNPPFISNPYFAISRDLKITSWQSLYGLRVAYQRGNLAVEGYLKSHATLEPVDQINSCIRMVIAKRADVCILHGGEPPTIEFTQAQPALRLEQFTTVNIYIWLAPQFRTQAEILSKVISKMKKEGSLATFQARMLNHSTPSKESTP